MTGRLLSPTDSAALVAKHLNTSWAERVCAEVDEDVEAPFRCGLRPGVTGSTAVERIGFDAWHEWRMGWKNVDLSNLNGVELEEKTIGVAGYPTLAPLRLKIDSLEAGLHALMRLNGSGLNVDIHRARRIGERLRDANAALTASTLKGTMRLSDADFAVIVDAVTWLHRNHDLSEWTTRQLQIPGMHTKWLETHGSLLRAMIGRDLRSETRPRLSIAHFTYVDPQYLATGGRRHDAWTTGDKHALAYSPRHILVVENRDCRLWFPEIDDTIVVEGSGKAAAASLGGIDWIIGAERLIYWGDIDADGFAILNNLRAALAQHGVRVDSMLMDESARALYAHLGVTRDKSGVPLTPSVQRLPNLEPHEAQAYAGIGTSGDAPFRRIEQERIPIADAAAALQALLSS